MYLIIDTLFGLFSLLKSQSFTFWAFTRDALDDTSKVSTFTLRFVKMNLQIYFNKTLFIRLHWLGSYQAVTFVVYFKLILWNIILVTKKEGYFIDEALILLFIYFVWL